MKQYLKVIVATAMLLLSTVSYGKESSKESELILNSDNTLILDEAIYDDTAAKVMQKAQVLDAKLKSGDPLYLVLYTPGGSIQAGLEMITMLKGLNRPVHTITVLAASMGFQTVQGLGTRYITHFGTLMAHKAKGAFQGEFPGQIDSRYVYYLKRLNELDRITVERSHGKLTLKSFQDLYENEYWVDGFDAVSKGLADEVVTLKCDHSLNGTRENMVDFMGFSIKVVYSACPAIFGPLEFVVMIQTNQGLMSLNEFLSKGGSLQKKNNDYSYHSYTPSYSWEEKQAYGPAPQPPASVSIPEANVEGLTMEKINAEIEKLRENKNKKPVVIKDYSNRPMPTNN